MIVLPRCLVATVGAIAIATVLSCASFWPSATLAQEATPAAEAGDLGGAAVTLHEGTCEEPSAEPFVELGTLEYVNLADPDSQPEGGPGLATEDANGNGALDEGEDSNGNGILDSGLDVDADGILEPFEIVHEGEVSEPGMLPANLDEIWMLTSDAEFDPDALFEEENVILVRQGEQLISCGVLVGVLHEEKQQFSINLMPQGDAPDLGLAIFGTDPDDREVEGERSKGVRVVMYQPPDAPSEQAATPTA